MFHIKLRVSSFVQCWRILPTEISQTWDSVRCVRFGPSLVKMGLNVNWNKTALDPNSLTRENSFRLSISNIEKAVASDSSMKVVRFRDCIDLQLASRTSHTSVSSINSAELCKLVRVTFRSTL